MKIFQINISPDASTGTIMHSIANEVIRNGGKAITAFAYKDGYHPVSTDFLTCGKFYRKANIFLGKILSCEFLFSHHSTIKLIKRIKSFSPDIIHMHNLHSYYLNSDMLFAFLKEYNKPVVWTFHDCWPFTGHCPHFVGVGCNKWKTQCFSCQLYKDYPYGLIDRSKYKYNFKKKTFTSLDKLTIVCPSEWLKRHVEQSFLSHYPTVVINNGIDESVFSPIQNDIKERYSCTDKKIVLGVSSRWNYKKGLDVFVDLAKIIPKDYAIILVGTDNELDSELPKEIVSVHSTNSKAELAMLYSSADVFLNPSREDTYPTVNMEALSCGTPVVTFNTGGSVEIIDDSCGIVVEKDDIDSVLKAVLKFGEKTKMITKKCLLRSQMFRACDKYNQYYKLYENLIKKDKDRDNSL